MLRHYILQVFKLLTVGSNTKISNILTATNLSNSLCITNLGNDIDKRDSLLNILDEIISGTTDQMLNMFLLLAQTIFCYSQYYIMPNMKKV